jgi:tetratricopeptide (TPR) repeat protein
MDKQPIVSANNVNLNDVNGQVAIGEHITQTVNLIQSPDAMDFLNSQNITITSKDTVLNEIGEWIETAKRLWSVNNDYDGALEIYDKVYNKLQSFPNNELMLKVLVGKSVCFHNKGNSAMANTLLQKAHEIDEENPIVLANISSFLRVNKNLEEAEIYARKSLDYDSNCILARTVLALIEYERGSPSEALKLLREAANIDQTDAYPVYSISYVYFRERKFDDAIKYGEKTVELERTTPSYHQHLGDVYLEASSPKNEIYIKDEFHEKINKDFVLKSIQCFEKAIELNSSQNNEHLNSAIYPNLASAFLVNDNFERSIQFNEKALECGIELDEIYMNLGMAHISLGNFKKCIEYYEPLVAKGTDSFVVRANLSIAYLIENQLDDAEQLLESLISESPEHLYLHIHLAQVNYRKGDFEEGIKTLNSASKHISLNWEGNHLLGIFHIKEGNYDLAAKHLKQSIKQNPKAIVPREALINLYLTCKIAKYALKYAEELVDLNPDKKSFNCYNLALIYYNMCNHSKAIEYSQKALEHDFNDVQVYRILCTSLSIECLIDEAMTYFKEGLEAYPEDVELNYNYAVLLTQIGEIDEAISILNWLSEPSVNFTPAHISLSNIHYSMKNDEQAIEHATKATLNDPNDEYAHFVLGNTLLKVGKVDEAVEQFNIVRRINPKTKYVISAPVEHLFSVFDLQFEELQDEIDDYENGYITLTKAAENAHLSISNALSYLNNKKVAESLNLSAIQVEQIEDTATTKKNAIVDTIILEILAQTGDLDLLKRVFDNIYVTKEFENKVSKNLYRDEEPYSKIRKKLSILKDGWIKGLTPNKDKIEFLSKLLSPDVFSEKELEFISLAIDNDAVYLTEDLLARHKMKEATISNCGIFGLLSSAIKKDMMTKEEGTLLYEKLVEKKYVSYFYDFE